MIRLWRPLSECDRDWYNFSGVEGDIGPSLDYLLEQYHYTNQNADQAIERYGTEHLDETSPYLKKNPWLPLQMIQEYAFSPVYSEILRGGIPGRKVDLGKVLPWLLVKDDREKYQTIDIFQQFILDTPPTQDSIIVFRTLGPFHKCQPGDEYIDPGFQSTSFDPHMSIGFASVKEHRTILRIYIPPGSHVLFNTNSFSFSPKGKIVIHDYDSDLNELLEQLLDEDPEDLEGIINRELLNTREVILPSFSHLKIMNVSETQFCDTVSGEVQFIQVLLIDAVYLGSLTRNPIQDRNALLQEISQDNCWVYRQEQLFAPIHAASISS